MKVGDIIENEGEKFIAQDEIRICSCTGCYFDGDDMCLDEEKKFCEGDRIILIKIPVELIEKIEQLEKQIEKMKCCANCKNKGNYKSFCESCENNKNWELCIWD